MNTIEKKLITSPWIYFLITFILSWGLCGILIFTKISNLTVFANSLLMLAIITPGITGILFTCVTKSKEEIIDYRKRILDVKRLSSGWLIIIIALPFLINIFAAFVDTLIGGAGLGRGDSLTSIFSNPANLLPLIFNISLLVFLAEMGWRGYAQDLFQKKYSALTASLILAMVWSLWHLPFSINYFTDQAGLNFGAVQIWEHFIVLIFLSITISWVYINSNRSILAVIIFQAMIKLADRIFCLSETGQTIYTFCLLSAVLTILLGFGKQMKAKTEKHKSITFGQRSFFAFGLVSLLSFTVIFQPAPKNPEILKENFKVVLQKNQQEFGFPGATAAYILSDGSLESVAVGQADKELNIAMTTESCMLAASIGKTFVAAAAIALAREGRLEIDAPVSTWLATYDWFSRLPNFHTITLRHLLNHSAGIPNHVEMEEFQSDFSKNWQKPAIPFTPEELVDFILDEQALFMPGEGWHYSDTGYILIGLIIEKVSGRTYYEEVTKRFLHPLKLDLTSPSDRRELPGLAAGYTVSKNVFNLPEKSTSQSGRLKWHPGIEWTGGGLISNPKDLVAWAKALYEGKAIQGNYLDVLLQSVPVCKDHIEIQYGLGVAIHKNGPFGLTYGHGGWIPGYCSGLRYYPDHGVAIAFQINTDIGITDSSIPVMEKIEKQLANVIINSLDK